MPKVKDYESLFKDETIKYVKVYSTKNIDKKKKKNSEQFKKWDGHN